METEVVSNILFVSGFVILFAFFASCHYTIVIAQMLGGAKLEESANKPLVRKAKQILSQDHYYLLSTQIGMFLSGVAAAWFLAQASFRGLGNFLPLFEYSEHFSNFQTYYSAVLFFIIVSLITIVTFLLSNIMKATLASDPLKSLCRLSILIIFSAKIISPFTSLVNYLGKKVFISLGLKDFTEYELPIRAERISELLEEGEEAGTIDESDSEMIQHVFKMSQTVAREVMTPRKDIIAIEDDQKIENVIKLFTEQGWSRVLVTGKSLDDVKGVLHAKDMLSFMANPTENFQINKLLRKPYFVPNTKKADDLLQEMRAKGVHLAVVVDEHGGVDGLITIEDLIEELVGEIFDEYDTPADETSVTVLDNGDLLIEGGALIDDLNPEYDLDLEKGEYDTIAGFVIHKLGHIPRKNEVLECANYHLKIEDVNKNRITALRLIRKKDPSVGQIEIDNTQKQEPKLIQNESKMWGEIQVAELKLVNSKDS